MNWTPVFAVWLIILILEPLTARRWRWIWPAGLVSVAALELWR